MGNIILVVVYVWLSIGFLYTLILYIRNKEFRELMEQRPLLILLSQMVTVVPILIHSMIIATKECIFEKRKQKEHQEDS